MDKTEFIGNTTSIITWVITTLAVSFGFQAALPGDLSIVIGLIVGFAFSMINSYYPNAFAFLDNKEN